jgi:hypothetical protein
METVQIRFHLVYPKGGTIAYLYGREGFEALGIPKEDYDGGQHLTVGAVLNVNDQPHEVKEIRYFMYREMQTMDTSVGVNLNSPQDPHGYQFNSTLVIVLDNI